MKNPSVKSALIWLAPVCIGGIAVLLSFLANIGFSFFSELTEARRWWPFVSLPAGGMALAFFMRRVGRGAEGSGIQQTAAAIKIASDPEQAGAFVNLRLALVKFAAIIGGLFSGFVLGLEGPTVQIGASIFYSFRKVMPEDTAALRRQLIVAGGAAGIAAAYNAPMAALVFAFEELTSHIRENALGKLVIAVILSGMIAEPVFGYKSYFGHLTLNSDMPLTLVPYLILVAFAGGFVGGAFSWLAVRRESWLPFPEWRGKYPYLFVAACGLLIACAGLYAPIFGSGAERVKEILHKQTYFLPNYAPLKFAGFLLTFLTGLPGGVFTPSLSIGASVGSYFLPLVGSAWYIEFMALGMVAVLAGVTRAPLTAAFIMIEMTDTHNMVLQALAVSFLAEFTARMFKVRFYHELAEQMLRREARRQR